MRTFPLVGPDVLLVAHAGNCPNNAIFVVECDGGLDVAVVQRMCSELAMLAPFMSARLERPFPWGKLRWTVDATPDVRVGHRRLGRGVSVETIVEEELNATIDPWRGPAVRWQVVDQEDAPRAWLVLTWVHPLMDPRGAELLVAMLDAMARGADGRRWAAAQIIEPPRETRPLRAQLRIARSGFERLRFVSAQVPRSLGRDVATPGRMRFRRRAVPAGISRPFPVTLAHVAAAVAELYDSRGITPGSFMVPISVDRRRKGEAGPLFSNYLSFHFACLPTGHLDDVAATAAVIRQEMADAVRSDAIEGLWAAMGLGSYYPPQWMLRPFKEEIASFHCADLGEVRPACPTLLNARVRGAYHMACVQRCPGLGIFLNRAAGYENIIVAWVDRVVQDTEVDALLAHLETALQAADAA